MTSLRIQLIVLILSVACGSEVALPTAHAEILSPITLGACVSDADTITTLRNSGGSTLSWEASIDLSRLSVDPNGIVPAGGSVDIHVRSTPQDPGPPLNGTLTLRTSIILRLENFWEVLRKAVRSENEI